MGVVKSTLLVVASNDISVLVDCISSCFIVTGWCKNLGMVLIRHLTTEGVEKHSERGYGRTLNAFEN